MRDLRKRLMCLLLALCLVLVVLPVGAEGQTLPDEVFLTQIGSGTCTLCSAAMMIRSYMYLQGNAEWSTVTQEGLRASAWLNGVGLKWNFKYTANSCVVHVGYQGVNGMSAEQMKAVLDAHPEGIVLYSSRIPHAVFLTDYEGDTFYCAETVKDYSGKRIPLVESWMGQRFGTQAAVLQNVTSYWYISAYEAKDGACTCREDLAGTYRVNTETADLLIRAGHGTGYSVVGYLPAGAEVTVLRAGGTGESDWAHVTYNGISGYCSMKYLDLIAPLHQYEAVVHAPTCTEGGYTVHTCKECGHSYQDTPVAALGHEFGLWIRDDAAGTERRQCIRCDAAETRTVTVTGTVTGDYLRIRAGAGTGYEVQGFLMVGDRVEILEQKTVGAMTWGRTEQGWISMTYVKLDETQPPVTEPPATEPPATEPPATEPPATEPPATEPPATEPPTTEPPATEPAPTGRMGTVTGNYLRIRAGAGTGYEVQGFLMAGDRVEILEQTTVGGMTWGRVATGWISLDYVLLDAPEPDVPEQNRVVTVNTDCLRVRGGAGLGYEIVGFLYRNAKVEILEETVVDGMTWGRIDSGWISMDYVK